MDARGRTDRVSVGQEQSIRGFGIEEYGAVVSRLVGKLAATGLTVSNGRAAQISGTDTLKIPLGLRPSDLIADVAEIGRVLTDVRPAPEFDLIDPPVELWPALVPPRCPRTSSSSIGPRVSPARRPTTRPRRRTGT